MDPSGPVKITEKSTRLDQTTWPVSASVVIALDETRLNAKDGSTGAWGALPHSRDLYLRPRHDSVISTSAVAAS
jgi:hypothetical protein